MHSKSSEPLHLKSWISIIFIFLQFIDPGLETEYEAPEEICYCNGSKDRLVNIPSVYWNVMQKPAREVKNPVMYHNHCSVS